MFEHSIKVPRLYKTAAKIAQQVKELGFSLKQLVFEKKHPNVKALYALVLSTLQNEENLDYIFQKTEILKKEARLDTWLARILVTELLWGKNALPGESKPITTILKYQDELLECSNTVKKAKIKTKKVMKPKYVRVNTLKITVEEVVNNFRDNGWSLIRCGDKFDYAAYLATVSSLSEDQFIVDIHIKELLVFPPKTQFYENDLYKKGCIFLQDKASCLPAYLLNPPIGSTVLDMCAAPGMKSIQLAAIVQKTGKVYAVERDTKRFETLKKIINMADASNITPINQDVLSLPPQDYEDVEMIVVDPSCSGSGMLERLDFHDKNTVYVENRLNSLSRFQISILKYALTKFKSVKRISYSTCSLFAQENEEVVREVISQIPDYKLVSLNEVLKDKWYNFGSKDFGEIGTRCIYSNPDTDLTNGFFIAVFERLKEGEVNEFFDKEKMKRHQNDSTDHYRKGDEYQHEDIDGDDINDNLTVIKKNKEEKEINNENKKMGNLRDHKTSESVNENVLGKNSHRKKKKKFSEGEQNSCLMEMDTDDFKSDEKIYKKKKKNDKENEKSDIMEENIDNFKSEEIVDEKSHKKKKKKNKESDKSTTMEENIDNFKSEVSCIDENSHKKKKKKKKKNDKENEESTTLEENIDEKSHMKKRKNDKENEKSATMEEDIDVFKSEESVIDEKSHKKKKKKKKNDNENVEQDQETALDENSQGFYSEENKDKKTDKHKKKKKHNISSDCIESEMNDQSIQKSKKKNKNVIESDENNRETTNNQEEIDKHIKKRKHKEGIDMKEKKRKTLDSSNSNNHEENVCKKKQKSVDSHENNLGITESLETNSKTKKHKKKSKQE